MTPRATKLNNMQIKTNRTTLFTFQGQRETDRQTIVLQNIDRTGESSDKLQQKLNNTKCQNASNYTCL